MLLKIQEITIIIQSHGQDCILLETNLPCPLFGGYALMEMRAPRGTAEDYVKKHFTGISCTVITTPKTQLKFSLDTGIDDKLKFGSDRLLK